VEEEEEREKWRRGKKSISWLGCGGGEGKKKFYPSLSNFVIVLCKVHTAWGVCVAQEGDRQSFFFETGRSFFSKNFTEIFVRSFFL
jgi:hypothetical protein